MHIMLGGWEAKHLNASIGFTYAPPMQLPLVAGDWEALVLLTF